MGPERLQLLGVCVVCAVGLLCLAQGEESIVHAKIGGVAELGCSLAPPTSDATAPPLFPLHVVEWVRRDFDVPVLIKFGPYAPRVHPNYEDRVSLSSGAALLVERVRLEDEGWFECRILRLNRSTAGSVNGTWTFLSVSAPPVFTKTPPSVLEAMQGNLLALTCAAHGNPPPTIIWTKDDMAVGSGEQTEVLDGTLTVRVVTRKMAGVYKCHVSNTEGSLTHATQLKVKGPPAILFPPKDTTLNISQNAQLQCRAESYPPNMTYVWSRHGENVYHIDSLKSRVKIFVDGTLLIPALIPEDSGNYTCMPTNGLLTPPTASAYLTVKHPAQVFHMPQVTYLPAGMGGRIVCPVRADPPLLSVSWTKDGRELDLNRFPGWMLMADGSLFMATANEDAIGTYTCTPYNSYGTMGPSQPTQVVLQDPPFFSVLPHEEYQQEVGTELVIPCHAHGDPSPSITWTKVGPAPRSPYTVAANGSLVLQLLSKDHHGAWECLAANRVATVTGHTRVTVLGTTPHAVSSVSVDPGTDQVNVSWVPGFDGGHAQKFTVWMKQTSGQKQKWVSLSVPPSTPHLLVTGLLPGTHYQFSVLPVNKVGTGPFGEIATVQTLVPLPDLPPAVTMVPELAPPLSLWANQSLIGIVLKWVPPPPQGPPITGFILQSRQEGEEDWNVLNGDIGANDSEILLQGLQKDCSYELRMLSLRDGLVSTPSQPLNISTAGMGAFPARPRLLEGGPKLHVAGVLAGVGVLSVVVLLLLGTACFLNRSKRHHRRRKKREDIPDGLQKCPPGKTGILADSPDSVLKMKACLLNTIFPKFAASRSDISSSDDSSCIECQDQDRQLLSQPRPKSCLWEGGECEGSGVPPNATLESISRGPDGRFIVQPCEDSSASSCIEDFPECHGGGSMLGDGRMSRWAYRRSSLLCSEREEKADLAVVLSVDLPDFSQGSHSDSDSYTDPCGSTRRCTPVPGDLAGWGGREGRAGSLPRDRAWELVDGRTLVTQMEQERETGHLSRCLTLAREREALERELERCEARLSLRAWRRESCGAQGPKEADEVPKRECSHQQDPQLRGKDWPRPDPRRGSHLGVDMAGLKVSASPCTPGDSSPIASVSRCVPAPCLERKAWPQDVSWEESGAGPFAPSSLPTNPESTCLLSDDVKAGSCLWRAPPKGSGGTSVSVPTREAGSDKNSTDSSQRCLLQERNEEGGKDNGGHSLGSTWPYRRGGGEHKTKAAESLGTTPGGSSTPSLPESEKEVVRAHLWQSDKSPFTDSPCSKSPLTNLIANSDRSSQPDFSVSQISGSVRPSPMPQHYETSQLHASPILKFLSLPGFVEMNVDEPVDNNNTAPVSSGLKSGQRPGNIFPSELKVVPLAWAAHTQKDREAGSRQRCAALAEELPAAGRHLRSSTEPLRMETCHFPAESGAVSSRGRMGPSEKCRPSSDGTLRRPLKRSQSLTCETPAGRGDPLTPVTDRTRRSDSHGGRASWGLSLDRDSDRALTQTTQGPSTQGSRTHPLPSVCDPVPHGRGRATTTDMNKTLRRGPNRTQREVPPDVAVRKSASLRLQTREHRANSEKPISQASRGAEFPSPEVWVRSLSLGCTSKSGPNSLRGRRRNSEVPPTHSSHHPPLPTATEHQRHPVSPDPRRQATVFPEAPGFPISYQEAPPLLKLNSTVPLYPSNPPNSALPPSWSHPGHAPLTQREPIDERGVEQESPVVAQCVEEAMDGSREEEGRGSYASQSSGRGSLGPLSHQSPSTTPTLTSSPATVQESKTGGRSRVSVDENYEWDATDVYLESDPPKASCTRLNQVCKDMEGRRGCKRPKDLDHKDDPLSHSSCVVKYQLSSGSTCSRDPDHDTVLF